MISTVQCRNQKVNVSWDSAANISLISHDAANRLLLKGSSISLSITKVGNTTEPIPSKEYTLPLADCDGKISTFLPMECKNLPQILKKLTLTRFPSYFQKSPQKISLD